MTRTHALVDGIDVALLPKISLHDHLDGALRPSTVLELADLSGVQLPRAAGPEQLAAWFVSRASAGSLPDYLSTFDLTVALMQTPEALTRIAQEYVADAAAEHTFYAEVRWAPEQHTQLGLTPAEAVEAVQEGLDLGVEDAHRHGQDIQVSQILCALRQGTRSAEIADLAIAFLGDGVCGFDLAGPEDGFPPSLHREALDRLARAFVPVTLHAGEAAGLDSIVSALADGRALRLGHGIRLADDLQLEDGYATLGPVAQWVLDRGIGLEVCPTSNRQTGALTPYGGSLEGHPLDLFYQLGMNVSVNVDNRLQSGTSLSEELATVARTFGYGLDDLEILTLNAAETAFLPADRREELAAHVSAEYAGLAEQQSGGEAPDDFETFTGNAG
jgi:adenosine deaminase